MGKRVFIIAGEASGDVHGANLVKAMAAADPSLSFRGVGGRELREAGVQLLWDAAEVAVVGLMEVARHLATIARVFRLAVNTLRNWHPQRAAGGTAAAAPPRDGLRRLPAVRPGLAAALLQGDLNFGKPQAGLD